jgi:glycosyltransferase involved in cell wall biosynthesis
MDAKSKNSAGGADRGIAPPKMPRNVGRRASELPLVGYRVRGADIVDCDTIAAFADAAQGPGPSSDSGNVTPSVRPLRKLSVLMPIYNERWTLATIVRRVLASPVELQIELVAVDDGSTDGSRELIYQLAQEDERIKIVFHPTNRGKGAAIRTAIAHMTGDVAVIQDADLEYDPAEYPLLLAPILAGDADAVFGSRFVGHSRRVLFFWHSLMNRGLTCLANLLNNLNLTDMETCYKMVRADVLKRLRLKSHTFTLEPEITCRLAQWGARIYEVPVSYRGRTYHEGKKIRAIDGLKALWEMFRCKFLDPQFTDHSGYYTLASVARAQKYNRWLLQQVEPFMGRRVLEAGSGIGNLSSLLLRHERLVLTDYEELYIDKLRQRYGARDNVRVEQADLTNADDYELWQDERLDTIVCSNVLEHLEPDDEVLRSFQRTLVPGGHCILVVPAGPWLYTPLDRELGHYRRYTPADLADKLTAAGFEVAYSRTVSRLGTIGWAVSGHLLRRRHLSARQMIWYDRLLPLAKVLDYVLPVPGMSLIMVGRKPNVAANTAGPAMPRRAAA